MNLSRQSLAIPIREMHDVGDARRQATLAARDMAFDETAAGPDPAPARARGG